MHYAYSIQDVQKSLMRMYLKSMTVARNWVDELNLHHEVSHV